MARMILVLCAVSVALLLVGCGGGTYPTAPNSTSLSVSRVLSNGLTASLSQDRAVVPTMSPVTYTVALTNTTNAPVTVAASEYLVTNQIVPQVSLRITDASGALVVQVSRGGARLTPMYRRTSVTLAPGQSISEEYAFPALFLDPGRYEAVAMFSIDVNVAATAVGPLAIQAQRP